MVYNLSSFSTVQQCDDALSKYTNNRNDLAFAKTSREGNVVSMANAAPMIPDRLEQLNARIASLEAAMTQASSVEQQTDIEIELSAIRGQRARLIKRSLNSEPDDMLEAQFDISELEFRIAAHDELIAALQARKAEINAGQNSAA